MKTIDLGGFTITASTQHQILIVFGIYTVAIVALGFFVKYQSRKSAGGGMSEFLTGSGDVSMLGSALMAATALCAGGTMVSAPGLSYRDGLVYACLTFLFFVDNFVALGTFGKKNTIMKNRLNAVTPTQFLNHRYQSKATTLVITLSSCIFLLSTVAGQFVNAAKIFATILGTNAYLIGMIVAAIVIGVYTLSGGVKSMARVCMIQGAIMLVSVVFILVAEYQEIASQYGSIQAASEFMARSEDLSQKFSSHNYSILYFISLMITQGWANANSPGFHQVSLTFNDHKHLINAVTIAVGLHLFIQVCMAFTGVYVNALNPNLTDPDYANIFITTTLLPGWMAGIVFSGIFAAIQSTVSAFLMVIAGAMAHDLYGHVINRNATEKQMSRVNIIVFIVTGIIAMYIARDPGQLGQLLFIIASGGIATTYAIPMLFGILWKKTTSIGALLSAVCGFTVYILMLIMSQANPDWFAATFNGLQPVIPGIITTLIVIIVVSLATQSKKVPLGIYQVWFCKDYDERFTTCYNLEECAKVAEEIEREKQQKKQR